MDYPSYNNWRLWEKEWHKIYYRAETKQYIFDSQMLVVRSEKYTEQHDILKEMNE